MLRVSMALAVSGVVAASFPAAAADAPKSPTFTRDELDPVSECAPLFGARLPALITAYKETESDPTHNRVMPRLSRELDQLLDGGGLPRGLSRPGRP